MYPTGYTIIQDTLELQMRVKNNKGFATRFDPFTPNQSNDERQKPYVNFDFPPMPSAKKRYCESCKQYVDVASIPKRKIKGWECDKCRGNKQ